MVNSHSYAQNYKEGVEFYHAGHYEQALVSLKKVIVNQPDFPDAYFLIARIYDELGHYEDAISMFQKVLDFLPNDLEAHHAYGKTLIRAGQEKKGLKILKKALKLNPKDTQIRTNLCQYFLRQQAPKKALSLIESGIKALPHHAPFYALAGDILRKLKRLEQAQEYYELCLELDPQHEGAKRGIDIVVRSMESSVDSLHDRSEEDEAREELIIAAELYKEGKYDSAIIRLLDLKNQAGVQKEASLLLGMAFAKKGLYKRSHDVFLAFIKSHTPDIMVLYNLGLALNRMGRYQEAINYLTEALNRDPEYEEALCEMGIASQMTGYLTAAREYFVKTLKIDRDNPRPYAQLARMAYDREDGAKTAEFLKRAKSIATPCPEVSLVEGYIFHHTGKQEKAIKAFEECLRQTPDHFEALKWLARSYFEMGDHTAAAEKYKAASALNPADQECVQFLQSEATSSV
ncbi:tetratricopeptide repeat protein [bacterium]|nr:tetratricopeptide repeat protein [bacterium]